MLKIMQGSTLMLGDPNSVFKVATTSYPSMQMKKCLSISCSILILTTESMVKIEYITEKTIRNSFDLFQRLRNSSNL